MKTKAKISTIIVSFMMIAIMCVAVPIIVDDSSAEPSTELDTVYVSNSGVETNDGTESSPVRLQDATSLVKSGGTIVILDNLDSNATVYITKAMEIKGESETSRFNFRGAFVFNNASGNVKLSNMNIHDAGQHIQFKNDNKNLNLEINNCTLSCNPTWGQVASFKLLNSTINVADEVTSSQKWYLVSAIANEILIENNIFDGKNGCRGALTFGNHQTGVVNVIVKNNLFKNFERGIQIAN